jgi:hypothetical protein
MTDSDAGSVPRNCPNCNYPIPPGRRTLCPNCHHPLIFDEPDDRLEAMANTGLHKPTETSSSTDTMIVPAVTAPPAPEAAAPGLICKSCGHVNPLTQMRCERCATLLADEPDLPPVTQPLTPAPPRRTGRLVFLVVGALVLALVLGLAAYLAMRRSLASGGPEASPSVSQPSSTATTAPVKLKRVQKKAIKAKASSTLPPDIYTYDVTNTLDGDPTTAWHSNGNAVGAFARVSLTYTFSSPVRLRAIEIYNGYQRSTVSFRNNSRVRRLMVSTDATKHRFNLRDKPGKQTISFDFGRTDRVVLTVEAVYRETKTKYKDCAISEVAFFRS